MPWSDWPNWIEVLQTGGVIGALLLMSVAVFLDARMRRVGNLIQLTQQHRELWERMYARPELARILDPDAQPTSPPVTAEEELFVIFIILHLSNTFYAMRAGFFQKPHGLRKDIQLFFSLPVPRAVWERVKDLQDKPFVRFVEACWPKPA